MGGPIGTGGGATPNIKDGTTPLMATPAPGPTTPPMGKYDIIAKNVFGNTDYEDFLRIRLTNTSFLTRPVANVHAETVSTLQAAQGLAIKSRGAGYQAPVVSSTLRRKKSMHAFGMAIDFDVEENPYILYEHNEKSLDQQLIVAYNHISEFILNQTPSQIPNIRKGRSAFGDGSISAVFDALKKESDAMVQYFAMMTDSQKLATFLATTWPTLHPGQTAPSAASIQSQMQTDYTTLGGNAANGQKLPTGNKAVDRPFAPISANGRGDPATGFLNLDKDFVLAMTGGGFAWGAIDLGDESGDIQHFDTSKQKLGQQVYTRL